MGSEDSVRDTALSPVTRPCSIKKSTRGAGCAVEVSVDGRQGSLPRRLGLQGGETKTTLEWAEILCGVKGGIFLGREFLAFD